MPPSIAHVWCPGVGKTRYVRRIANVLGLLFCDITLAGNSDAFKVTGLSRYWSTAGPGTIASTFAHADIGNPVFLLDEIDKSHKSGNGDPLSRILLLLERESATTFKDDFIDVPMDVSHASYLATANSIEILPEPLLSRFICLEIKPLDFTGRCICINNVYNEMRVQEKYGAFFAETLSEDALLVLAGRDDLSGRELKRTILQAMQRACKEIVIGNKPDNNLLLKVNDLRLPGKKSEARIIGFIA